MTKAQQDRALRLLPNGVPRWVRCYDNGGETIDRYTVVFTGRYTHKTARQHIYLGMSVSPFHPQGVAYRGESGYQIDSPGGTWPPAIGRRCHLGTRIKFEDLPDGCRTAALIAYLELWGLHAA